MKRIRAFLLVGIMLLSLPGCLWSSGKPEIMHTGPSGTAGTEPDTELEYRAQYIRTNGGYEATVLYPGVRIIHSLQELNDYYTTWHGVFDLERKEQVYSDTTIGFLDACDRYDEAFFEENYLIFVLLKEGSGSIRHAVRSVTQTEDKLIAISIGRNVPEAGTDDMAQWHIMIELSRDVIVENSIDTMIFIDGMPSYMDDRIVFPQAEGAFKSPPKGMLRTPEGDVPLISAGYSWTVEHADGTATTTIADQTGRPLPKDRLKPVTINNKYAETVYAPVPGRDTYAPTNSLGYLLKLNWEANPTSVAYTCWPDTVWQDSNTPEESVVSQNNLSFYGKPGGYIYEITATWADTGPGYYGTANYYVYIIG